MALKQALALFLTKRGIVASAGAEIFEGLVNAACEHQELAPIAPPRTTKGRPKQDELLKQLTLHEYLVGAGRVATLLEIEGKETFPEEICREIVRRRYRAAGRPVIEDEIADATRSTEAGRFSRAKKNFSKLVLSGKMPGRFVAKKMQILSNRQLERLTYEWVPSDTEMEKHPEWKTIYAKHNYVKKLSKKSP